MFLLRVSQVIFLGAPLIGGSVPDWCDRLPRLFWPANPAVPCPNRSAVCMQRMQTLLRSVTAIGVEISPESALNVVEKKKYILEDFLRDHQERLSRLLVREGLLLAVRPAGGEFLEVYEEMFNLIPVDLFAVLLFSEKSEISQNVYKAVMLASYRKAEIYSDARIPSIGQLIRYVFVLTRTLQASALPALYGPWSAEVQDHVPLRENMIYIRQVNASALYVMLKSVASSGFDLRSRALLRAFVANTRASEALIAQVRRTPLEVHPQAKALCLTLRLDFFCRQVVEATADGGYNAGRLAQFRRDSVSFHAGQVGPVGNFLALELDYVPLIGAHTLDTVGAEVFELMGEYASISQEVVRIFQIAREHDWPLLERVLVHAAWPAQAVELQLMLTAQAALSSLTIKLVSICQDAFFLAWKCHQVRDLLVEVPTADLLRLASVQGAEAKANEAERLARRLLKLTDQPEITALSRFIHERAVNFQQVPEAECALCFHEYNDLRSPVGICAPMGAFEGHHVCADCVEALGKNAQTLVCPFCRAEVDVQGQYRDDIHPGLELSAFALLGLSVLGLLYLGL